MTATDTITITFRGVRGSHPMPGPTTLRYGGNTTCQEIRAGGRLIVFDAGTGIISLGNDMVDADETGGMAMFFSHNHHDHIGGLLYFKPAYVPGTTMHIFGPAGDYGETDIVESLERLSSPSAHPVQFSRMGMRYTSFFLSSGDVVAWSPGEDAPRVLGPDEEPGAGDVTVRAYKNNLHPVRGVLNFRLEYAGKAYVYATDVEGDEKKGDPDLAAFAKGADLLAHDGQYTSDEYFARRRGWGHSTIAMAVRTAKMAEVKELAIIHHDPGSSDDQLDAMQKAARRDFPNLFFAREGQVVVL